MPTRTTVRTVVTLVAALSVITLFAGSAAAFDFGGLPGDDSSSAPVDVNVSLGGDASPSGGGGVGAVEVTSDQGDAKGVGGVSVSDEPELNADLGGVGTASENTQAVGISCTFNQTTAQNPQSACETTPSADGFPPGGNLVPQPGTSGVDGLLGL